MSILAWIGWIVLGLLALAGLIVLGAAIWFFRTVKSAITGFNVFTACPAGFRLNIRRQARQGVPESSEGLLQSGMSFAGSLELQLDSGSYTIDLLQSADRKTCILAWSNEEDDRWVSALRVHADGRTRAWTNAYNRFHVAWSLGEDVTHLAGLKAETLIHDAFNSADPEDVAFPETLKALRRVLATLMARSWVRRYQNGPGDIPWAELLPYDPEFDDDANPQEDFAKAAAGQITAICASAYLYSTDKPAGEWSLARERLLFVPECIQWNDLLETRANGLFIHLTDELEDALEATPQANGNAVAHFEAINAQLPERDRYQRFDEFTRPVRGAVFLGPKPKDLRSGDEC